MEQTQTDSPMALLSWQALTQPHFERSNRWYVICAVIVLALATYGILTKSWPFAVVMVMLGAMYYILRGHVPPEKVATISNRGVQLDQKFLTWDEIEGFWFIFTPDYTELHVTPKQAKKADLVIQTGNVSVAVIRNTMQQFVPELTEKKERLLDLVVRTLKI